MPQDCRLKVALPAFAGSSVMAPVVHRYNSQIISRSTRNPPKARATVARTCCCVMPVSSTQKGSRRGCSVGRTKDCHSPRCARLCASSRQQLTSMISTGNKSRRYGREGAVGCQKIEVGSNIRGSLAACETVTRDVVRLHHKCGPVLEDRVGVLPQADVKTVASRDIQADSAACGASCVASAKSQALSVDVVQRHSAAAPCK